MTLFSNLVGEILQLQKEQTKTLNDIRAALDELKSEMTKSTLLQKEVLTLAEASQMTGISKSHLYKNTSSRSIPFYKPSKKLIFFRRSEIEDWITKERFASVQEIESSAMNFRIHQN